MGVVPHTDVTYKIIGCAMAVHNELGPGLREGHYQRALAVKMEQAGLSHEDEKPVQIFVDGVQVGLLYLDHIVNDCVVVEVKALRHQLTDDEVGQVITYLAATGYPLGLLLSFARRSLEYRRILPPKKVTDWTKRIRRYLWLPNEARRTGDANPFIRSRNPL